MRLYSSLNLRGRVQGQVRVSTRAGPEPGRAGSGSSSGSGKGQGQCAGFRVQGPGQSTMTNMTHVVPGVTSSGSVLHPTLSPTMCFWVVPCCRSAYAWRKPAGWRFRGLGLGGVFRALELKPAGRRVQGLGLTPAGRRVQGLGLKPAGRRVQGLGLKPVGRRVQVLGLKPAGRRVQGLGLKPAGRRVQGFRVEACRAESSGV